MKSLMKIFALLIVVNLSTLTVPQKASAEVAVSLQVFYDQLSPYGNWVDYPSYGYVWVPNVGGDFSPYGSSGHWVFTNVGWTWVSDYPWGWAPFHYGRWYFDPVYGWIWVPDTVWGPAWVVWRSSPGYFGWAPLRPGVSISIAFGPTYYVPNEWWIFSPAQYITSPTIYQYYVPRSNNVTIIKNTTIINKTYVDNGRHATYVAGPDADVVQKATGRPVKPMAIREIDKPGQSVNDGQLNIFRPKVDKTLPSGQKPVPRKVVALKDLKPTTQKSGEAQKKNDVRQSDQMKNVTPSKEQGRDQNAPKKVTPQKEQNPQQNAPKSVTPQKEQQERPPVKRDEPKKDVPKQIAPQDQARVDENRNVQSTNVQSGTFREQQQQQERVAPINKDVAPQNTQNRNGQEQRNQKQQKKHPPKIG